MHLGHRIRHLRKQKNLKQPQLAQLVGIKQQALSYIERTGRASAKTIIKIAERLGITEQALRFGDENEIFSRNNQKDSIPSYAVPLLTSSQIKTWLETGSINHQEKNMPKIITTKRVGKNTRAFIVTTEAMRSDRPDSVMPGDVAIVDSDKPLVNNCLVAVIMGNDLTVRLYKHEEGRQFLVAYHPDYPTIQLDKKVKIVGPIIETHRDRYPADTVA